MAKGRNPVARYRPLQPSIRRISCVDTLQTRSGEPEGGDPMTSWKLPSLLLTLITMLAACGDDPATVGSQKQGTMLHVRAAGMVKSLGIT